MANNKVLMKRIDVVENDVKELVSLMNADAKTHKNVPAKEHWLRMGDEHLNEGLNHLRRSITHPHTFEASEQ